MVTKIDFTQRFGFLVSDVGRLYGRRFDQLARQRLGLSRAQCRLLGVLAAHPGPERLSQAALAERLELTPMGVAGLCDRMEAAGWIRRQASETDRRVNEVALQPQAMQALEQALAVSDTVAAQALAGLTPADRKRLMDLLRQAHGNLAAQADDKTPE